MCNIFSPFIIQFYYYVQVGPKIVIQTYLDWTITFVPPCNITQCVQSNKNFIPSFLHVSVCLEKFSRLGILKSTVLSYYNFVYCCSLFLHHSNGLGFVSLRRRFLGDVHDRWPEKILRSHEENGQQKASQSYSKAESKLDKEYFWPDPKVPNKRTFMISYNLGYV